MNEQPPLEPSTENQKDSEGINRRDATKAGLAAAGLALIGGGSILKMRSSNDEAVEMPLATAEPFPELTPVDYVDPEQTTEAETSYAESKPLGNAEFLRKIAEDEGEAKLAEFFQITKEEAPTPSAFALVLSERIRDWISGGCTPEEAGQYTPESIADYVAEMGDKYGVAAATGLGKPAPDGDIRHTALFQKINTLHAQVLTYYMNLIHEGAADTAVIIDELLSHEMTGQDPYNNLFEMAVELQYTITSDDAEPLVMSGMLNLDMHTASPTYELILDDNQPTIPFETANG